MEATAETVSDLVRITVSDWEHQRSAELNDVLRDTTVGEIVDEARRVMDLPIETAYQAVLEGRELNQMQTLAELGIDTDTELEIVPDVQAG